MLLIEDPIVGVAFKHEDGLLLSMQRPARHDTLIRALADRNMPKPTLGATQGFITRSGRFLNRRVAAAYALAIGQIQTLEHSDLYSEDLW